MQSEVRLWVYRALPDKFSNITCSARDASQAGLMIEQIFQLICAPVSTGSERSASLLARKLCEGQFTLQFAHILERSGS